MEWKYVINIELPPQLQCWLLIVGLLEKWWLNIEDTGMLILNIELWMLKAFAGILLYQLPKMRSWILNFELFKILFWNIRSWLFTMVTAGYWSVNFKSSKCYFEIWTLLICQWLQYWSGVIVGSWIINFELYNLWLLTMGILLSVISDWDNVIAGQENLNFTYLGADSCWQLNIETC